MLIGPINSGAAVGNDGAATITGTSSQIVQGWIYSVVVKYNDSPPAGTTVVTVKTKGSNGPSKTILTITNSATDKEYLPRLDTCSPAGVVYSSNDALTPVDDYVQVVIAGANAGDNVDVYLSVVR